VTQQQAYARAVLVASSPLLVLTVSGGVAMFLGRLLPQPLSSLLLFLPQLVFPYSHYYYITHEPFTRSHTVGGQYSALYSLIEWLIILGLAALPLRRLPPRQILLITVAVILVVTTATHVVLSLLGYKFELLAL